MNISQARLINLVAFLEQEGYKPCKQKGPVYWFCSPLRNEKTSSFKVDSNRNEWYDFGIGKGGDILDLVKGLYDVNTTSEALKVLAPKSSSFINSIYRKNNSISARQESSLMKNVTFYSLQHQALLSYLMRRRINLATARVYCSEVNYEVRGKHYFGIGFRNRIGGYEIRNQYYKGCFGHKDITIIKQKNDEVQDHVAIFEGFMDFLSYLMFLESKDTQIVLPYSCDYIIMNSINCLEKTIAELSAYRHVHSFLDNDDGGTRTFLSMKERLGDKVLSESSRFFPYNDLNDYLVKTNI